jgi:glycosyltransferase involved in cell wall biosynthesis
MRIAIWHNLPSGGGKRALHDHVRGLVERGHTVEAWCPPTADLDFLPLAPMAREHVVDLEWKTPLRWTDEWQITLRIARSLAALDAHCRQCAADIARGDFDVLFANTCCFTAASPIGRHATIPSVLYLQEPHRSLYEAQPRLPWLAAPPRQTSPWNIKTWRAAFADLRQNRNWRLQAREEVDNAAAFTRILVNSRFSRESILRSYGLDADVCYLGIDTERFVDLGRPREDLVVGLGQIAGHKNPLFCLKAIGATRPPRPKFVWIGNAADPGLLAELHATARALEVNFEARVKIPDEELLATLNRARVMVYAPRLEPFGLAPLEANACGVPVVAVAEGGVRETIVDGVNGFLVEHDAAAMAAAIDRLRTDPAMARRMGADARRNVETKWGLRSATDRIEQHLLRYARRP